MILEVFGQLTAQQVIDRLDEAQIANAQVNAMADVWAHPQLRSRDRFREVGSPAGPISALLPPAVNSSFGYRMDPIPAIGQHSDAILRELGRGEAEIAAMRAAGAI